MALTDIVFAEGDLQSPTFKIPLGTLNEPIDIVIEEVPCEEIPEPSGSSRRIFIMVE
jgi:hypothetical protein